MKKEREPYYVTPGQTRALTAEQQHWLSRLVERATAGREIRPKDISTTDIHHVTQSIVASIWGVTRSAVVDWSNRGLEKNLDGTYDLGKVRQWLEDRAARKAGPVSGAGEMTLDQKKTSLEIEKLEIANAKARGDLIDRNEHEAIMVSRASTLSRFLQSTMMSNASKLAGKPLDELQTLLMSLVQEMMEVYSGQVVDTEGDASVSAVEVGGEGVPGAASSADSGVGAETPAAE